MPAPTTTGEWVFQAKGDLPTALRDYNRALEIDPEHVPALYNRVTLLLRTGRQREALADLNEILRIDPRQVKAHVFLEKSF